MASDKTPCEVALIVFATIFSLTGVTMVTVGVIYALGDEPANHVLYFTQNGTGYNGTKILIPHRTSTN